MVRFLHVFIATSIIFTSPAWVNASEKENLPRPAEKSSSNRKERDFSRLTDSQESNAYVSPSSDISEDETMHPKSTAKAEPAVEKLETAVEKSEPAIRAAETHKSTDKSADKKDIEKSTISSSTDDRSSERSRDRSNISGSPELKAAKPEINAAAKGIQEAAVHATQATNASSAAIDLQVLEFVLANQVEGREPKDTVESFTPSQDRGFAFARLSATTNSKVTFVWYRNGHEYARSTLPVNPSKKWRTYSSVKLRPGEWKVQLLAEDKLLAEKTFTLE